VPLVTPLPRWSQNEVLVYFGGSRKARCYGILRELLEKFERPLEKFERPFRSLKTPYKTLICSPEAEPEVAKKFKTKLSNFAKSG